MSHKLLSGVVLSQNVPPEHADDFILVTDEFTYQTFYLPASFVRGEGSQSKIPALSGLQIFVGVDEGYESTATLDWTLDYYIVGTGWTNLTTGTTVGTTYSGDEVWFTIYFDQEIEIPQDALEDQFRFGVRGRVLSGTTVGQIVDHDATTVIIDGEAISIIPDISPSGLQEGQTYSFDFNGIPSLIYVEPGSGNVYYSVQQGVNRLWYTTPNPLTVFGDSKALGDDETTAIDDDSRSVSLMFRLLATTADEGVDFLGNIYRSVLTKTKVDNVSTLDAAVKDRFWLSAPIPSRFGVVSLYFDISQEGAAQVVDHVLIDPLTPDVYFQIYYSNDPVPGSDEASWENLLWTHIPQTFQMHGRKSHTLPDPISAKYIKIEFSHLQAAYYAPGNFQKPTLYKKHPKWVLDYFLARILSEGDQLIGNRIEVIYDALDLAYSYYRDDIDPGPREPTPIDRLKFTDFLKQEDLRNQIDDETLDRIRIAFRPFLNAPAVQGKNNYLLGSYLRGAQTFDSNYSSEQIERLKAITSEVSSLNRESVVIEKTFPVMFFYVTSRHSYRLSAALFEEDRAYYAGVKEIAFTREHYAEQIDSPLYIETASDLINVERSDFEIVEQAWRTYANS